MERYPRYGTDQEFGRASGNYRCRHNKRGLLRSVYRPRQWLADVLDLLSRVVYRTIGAAFGDILTCADAGKLSVLRLRERRVARGTRSVYTPTKSPPPATRAGNPSHIRGRPPAAAQNARSGRNAPRYGGRVHRLSQDENRGWCRPAPPWCLAMQTETNGVTMVSSSRIPLWFKCQTQRNRCESSSSEACS
jgi:hypothetical protein